MSCEYIPIELTSGHGKQNQAATMHPMRARVAASHHGDNRTEGLPELQIPVLEQRADATSDGTGDPKEEACEIELTLTAPPDEEASREQGARIFRTMMKYLERCRERRKQGA